ncbi:hypothetical protein HI914_02193 [Erysiphe necator]|nr:hypothetical protein HI914_02193 [Erysiphe necator]
MSDIGPRDFSIYTTLRHDPFINIDPIPTTVCRQAGLTYMLHENYNYLIDACLHFQRVQATGSLLGQSGLLNFLTKLAEFVELHRITHFGSVTPLLVKILVHMDGTLSFQCSPTPRISYRNLYPKSLSDLINLSNGIVTPHQQTLIFILHVFNINIQPSDHTRFKTTFRSAYNDAQDEYDVHDTHGNHEVLLVNESGQIMGGSFSNVYFRRDDRWVTPSLAAGGENGVMRKWALNKGLCVEGTIMKDSLTDGEMCCIGSSARGFHPANLCLI